MPKRSRSGEVSRPARVVAPTSVNGASASLIERAAGPSHHDVELVVLHRGIERLLDDRREPVDLVDEQHIARLQVGEDRGEVARPLEHRPRGLAQVHAELGGQYVGERGLAEARRSEDEDMVQRLAARARRVDEDAELFFDGALADIVGEALGADRAVERFLLASAGGADDAIARGRTAHAPPARAADCSARRMRSSVLGPAPSPAPADSAVSMRRVASAGR